MRKSLFILIMFGFGKTMFAQNSVPDAYFTHVKFADSLLKIKAYQAAALNYSRAFRANKGRAFAEDRYNAACAWAMASQPDSAFLQLRNFVKRFKDTSYNKIIADSALSKLHSDNRWKPLVETVKKNKETAERKVNKSLMAMLESISARDQKVRTEYSEISKKYDPYAKERLDAVQRILETDSINLIQVKGILDTYGWLGPDIVGVQGNMALFLVIQHSDLGTQKRYLPILRKATKKGNARKSMLAYLEDRVALGQGKRQIYGTQLGRDNLTNQFVVLPIEDPISVDKRRAQMGLGSIAKYLEEHGINWDAKKYKAELKDLEKRLAEQENY